MTGENGSLPGVATTPEQHVTRQVNVRLNGLEDSLNRVMRDTETPRAVRVDLAVTMIALAADHLAAIVGETDH